MNSETRILFLFWQHPERDLPFPIGRLVATSNPTTYEFVHVRGVLDAIAHGFDPYMRTGALDRVDRSSHLLPVFTNRLMRPSRPDYREHLECLDLSEDASPAEILGRSEGQKATDFLEVSAMPRFDARANAWVYHAFARGIFQLPRAEDAIRHLRPGDSVAVEPEPTNADEPRRFALRKHGEMLGWLPGPLVSEFGELMRHGSAIRAHVVRVNPSDLGCVSERLLIECRADHRDGFAPFSASRFQPIPADASVTSPVVRDPQ